MQVDVLFHVDVHPCLGHAAAALRVAFAPESVRADVHEGDFGASVIARGECLEKVFEFLQEDGVDEVGIPIFAIWRGAAGLAPAKIPERALGAGFPDPFGCREAQPGFAAGDTEGNLSAFGDPALGGGVKCRPVVLALLGLEKRPGYPEVADGAAGEPGHVVAGLQRGAVVRGGIRIVVHRPTHVGIDEGASIVGRTDRDAEGGEACEKRKGVNQIFHRAPLNGDKYTGF